VSEQNLLVQVFVYLFAAVIAVPLSKRFGLGSVLGYLIAGVAIGPWGLGLIRQVDDILHFAEFGVVLLLFLIGLELNPKRLWAMRVPILGMGGAQVVITALLIASVALLLGIKLEMALVIGMGLSLSSTAMVLQILREKNLLQTPAGRSGFSILLFQDIAVIPMLAIIPLLSTTVSDAETDWTEFVKTVAAILVIVLGGRYLIRPVLRTIANTGPREIFTAFALLLVIGIALLMNAVGLSMALGSFLAGVLLAESEYRHALESDIEPFKGLLLGLFFIAVGMSVNFGIFIEQPILVFGLVLGLITLKALVLLGLARAFRLPPSQYGLFAVVLSQGGEFAFVLFSFALSAGVLDGQLTELLIGVVAVSMMTTPLLMILNERFIEPRFATAQAQPEEVIEHEGHPVIIAGFGRFGQIVGRLLHANGIDATILDHDPNHIEMIRKFNFKVFYGDAARLDLLESAGAEHARILIVAVDDRETANRIVEMARMQFPNLTILTRAWDLVHNCELLRLGVQEVERETFEGALKLGEQALKRLGMGAWKAKQAANVFRAHDEQLSDEIYRHFEEDIAVRAAIVSNRRENFRKQMEADDAAFEQSGSKDW
jgi:glutathione-regulated potassium-efflux system ancillary protein KefC